MSFTPGAAFIDYQKHMVYKNTKEYELILDNMKIRLQVMRSIIDDSPAMHKIKSKDVLFVSSPSMSKLHDMIDDLKSMINEQILYINDLKSEQHKQ